MIEVLDCTLRDGGYINEWRFGKKNIDRILLGLSNSKVNIIECGFVTNKPIEKGIQSKFASIEEAEAALPQKSDSMFVCMINCGEYDPNDLPEYNGGKLCGIRIAFHKKDLLTAEEFASIAQKKGFKVFYQPMVTINYTSEELQLLFNSINRIKPYAAYIVDSFGSMRDADILNLFEQFNKNIHREVKIGFHAHNNLQLAYSNALLVVERRADRNVILDSSVYGMGRGAGNLCTELITSYLNANEHCEYDEIPLLQIVDECLMPIYLFSPWGYSIPYYLSAINNCHPNYASFLMNKQTLNVREIHKIISKIPQEARSFYDKNLIGAIYNDYQRSEYDDSSEISVLKSNIQGKTIVVIAPGRSISDNQDVIKNAIEREDRIVVGINFKADSFHEDYIFIGNNKRLRSLDKEAVMASGITLITTSNLQYINSVRVNYTDLIDPTSEEADNSGIMCLRLLKKCGAKKVLLAGFDGFDINQSLNYVDNAHVLNVERQYYTQKTLQIKKQLDAIRKEMDCEFLTPSLYN